MAELARRFCVGYAFTPRKEESLLTPSLVNRWKERGIDLVRIDTLKPLTEQGPFDCVTHKLYGEVWGKQLDEFSSQNPNVVIIDPMDAVERLNSRVSMLEVVRGLRIAHVNEILGIPKQVVVDNSEAFCDTSVLEGLEFPVIAKSLVADGIAGSHSMSLVYNREGLSGLKPPIVLQEFVNHGGVVFKVYVVGKYVKCVRRRSLPDVSEENLRTAGGLLSFSRISNLSAQDQSGDFETKCLDIADMPPLSFITDIANGLRQAMRLSLFNFDVIRDTRVGNRYLVIDINYFPGYAKMPSYETVLTDFFWDILHENPTVLEVRNSGSDGREILSCCKDEQNL